MNKFKLFIENFLVYGLGGIISKIVPLIMVPIVTRLMPNSTYYGLSDMSNTVMNFCIYLSVLGMYDAMYRMFFEKDNVEYKKMVCSTAFIFNLIVSLVVFIGMLIARRWIAEMFFDNAKYAYLVYLTAMASLIGGTNSIISAPTRMQNKRKIFLITNTLGPVLSYAISIPLLLQGHYVIALPLAGAISGLILEISFGVMNHKWFSLRLFDKKLLGQLLKIALPLFPNFLIYWVFNSCDRIMITKLIGINHSGVYSVGAKLGMASQLIYTAFAGGWQFFAFSTMNEDDQVESNTRIFEYLGCISFVCTLFICAVSEPIYHLLFTKTYHGAFIVAPYLFLAPLIQMLFQVASNQFLVIKKTWPNLLIMALGAVLNVALNYVLIPTIGIEGASIATLMGYVLSMIICVIVLSKMELFVISKRFIITTIIFIMLFIAWRLFAVHNTIMIIIMALLLSGIVTYIYRKDIQRLVKSINERKK